MVFESIGLLSNRFKLICKAVICILLLNACSTAEDVPSLTDALDPKHELLDLSTDNKPKKAVETPTGVKYIYDPHQDEDLKVAFRALMQIKQQAGYFEGWPEKKAHRSQKRGPVRNTQEEWQTYFNANGLKYSKYHRAVRRAHVAQKHDYSGAGCKKLDHRHCLNFSSSEPCFKPKPIKPSPRPVNQTNEAGNTVIGIRRVWECEPTPRKAKDIPIPSLSLTFVQLLRVCPGNKLPFETAHVGDPKRGSFKKQFNAHYSMQCSEW